MVPLILLSGMPALNVVHWQATGISESYEGYVVEIADSWIAVRPDGTSRSLKKGAGVRLGDRLEAARGGPGVAALKVLYFATGTITSVASGTVVQTSAPARTSASVRLLGALMRRINNESLASLVMRGDNELRDRVLLQSARPDWDGFFAPLERRAYDLRFRRLGAGGVAEGAWTTTARRALGAGIPSVDLAELKISEGLWQVVASEADAATSPVAAWVLLTNSVAEVREFDQLAASLRAAPDQSNRSLIRQVERAAMLDLLESK